MHENNENLKNTTEHDPNLPHVKKKKFRIKSINTVQVDLHSALCFKSLHAMVSTFYIAAVNKLGISIVYICQIISPTSQQCHPHR